ncbi:hypothetical protein GOV09_06530 [Candidatus Woesearchaeota archaeon]|nr:hypothetical protein [Candidatus Woesearchaeota archaeon]
MLRGEVNLFGYRPRPWKEVAALPADVRRIRSKHRPGLVDAMVGYRGPMGLDFLGAHRQYDEDVNNGHRFRPLSYAIRAAVKGKLFG